jgi:hypothetical protein
VVTHGCVRCLARHASALSGWNQLLPAVTLMAARSANCSLYRVARFARSSASIGDGASRAADSASLRARLFREPGGLL